MITSMHVTHVYVETTCLALGVTNPPLVLVVNARGYPKPSPSRQGDGTSQKASLNPPVLCNHQHVRGLGGGESRLARLSRVVSLAGLPKAAVITHLQSLKAAAGFWAFGGTEEDVVYIPLPLYHSAASLIGIGGTIHLGTSPPHSCRFLRSSKQNLREPKCSLNFCQQ